MKSSGYLITSDKHKIYYDRYSGGRNVVKDLDSMKILMMTNSYFPVVGGVEQSIRSFSNEFRRLGHEVMIVAPAPKGSSDREENVIRVPAIEKVQHSQFSVNLPVPGILSKIMDTFTPDIVHSHYPFFMGDFALRLSRQYNIPMVFTYHIMFEHYVHYLPIHNEGSKRFMVKLAAGYANWARQVIAPSESVRDILFERGVTSPIEVVPTGINLKLFSKGNGKIVRKRNKIPLDAFVVGYAGRLASEKNLDFLIKCLVEFAAKQPNVHVLMVGQGPAKEMIHRRFAQAGVAQRLRLTGFLHDQDLADAYHAMDVFAFASLSETQGMVLVEAMAAGVPVVAVDASGVREVVRNYANGRLINEVDQKKFVKSLLWVLRCSPERLRMLKQHAQKIAQGYSIDLCAMRMIDIYERLRSKECRPPNHKDSSWHEFVERIKAELDIFKNLLEAGEAAINHG